MKKKILLVLRDLNTWGFRHLFLSLSAQFEIYLILEAPLKEEDKKIIGSAILFDYRKSRTDEFVQELLKGFLKNVNTSNFRYGRERDIYSGKGRRKYLLMLKKHMPGIFSSSSVSRIISRLRNKDYDAALKKINPDYVLYTAFLLSHYYPVLRAEALGYKTAALIYSWDNPYKYNYLPAQHYRYLVWNNEMCGSISRLHNIEKENCVVTGAIQFDYLKEIIEEPGKIPFSKELKEFLNNNRDKYYLYLFSTTYNAKYQEVKLLEHISAVLSSVNKDAVILARLYPNVDDRSVYNPLSRLKNVFVDDTGLQPNEAEHYAAVKSTIIKGAKAVINLGTTMALEAAVLDKIIIQINYIPDNITFSSGKKLRPLDLDYLMKNDHLKEYLLKKEYANVIKDAGSLLSIFNMLESGNIEVLRGYTLYLKKLADPLNGAKAVDKIVSLIRNDFNEIED